MSEYYIIIFQIGQKAAPVHNPQEQQHHGGIVYITQNQCCA